MWGEKKKKSLHFEGFLGRRGLRMQPGFTVNKKVKRTLSEGIVDVENFVAVGLFYVWAFYRPSERLWKVTDQWEMGSNVNGLGGLD